MTKIYALMKNEEVLEKSEHRNELTRKRDELQEQQAKSRKPNNDNYYVCVWLGHVQFIDGRLEVVEV